MKSRQIKHLIRNAYNRSSFTYAINARLSHQNVQVDLKMLWDTGATYTGISRVTFEQLKILPDESKVYVTFGAGDEEVLSGIADNLALDGVITVNNVKVVVLPDAFFKAQPHLSGILGSDFLRNLGFYMGHGFIRVYQDQPKGE